jgi:hypothetical protein
MSIKQWASLSAHTLEYHLIIFVKFPRNFSFNLQSLILLKDDRYNCFKHTITPTLQIFLKFLVLSLWKLLHYLFLFAKVKS